jgi:hypothetical protein
MDFDDIFQAYYTQFRGDSDVPTSSDDEYTVGMRMANEAINFWNSSDNFWKELFTNLQDSAQVSPALITTITTGDTTYTTPTDFVTAGGFVRVKDSNGNDQIRYPIIEPQDVQFKDSNATYCYFTGDSKNGHVLHLNPAPTANLNGLDIDYVYYKSPTLFTTGTDVTEMANPYFIVHRMLANQFRAARNPYYASATTDADDALNKMQQDNYAGNWANTPSIGDTSGSMFGS